MNRLALALAVAAACSVATGCSSTMSNPPPTTTTTAAVSPSASSQSNLLEGDDLGSMTGVLWREDINYDKGPVNNEDLTLPAGSYELQAVCSGDTRLRVSIDRGRLQPLTCLGALAPGLKVCTNKAGLFVTLERLPGGLTDLVWQLKKAAPERCTK